MRRAPLALLVLWLAACGEDLAIEPARLPRAHLGSPYKTLLSFPNADSELGGVEHSGELPDGLSLSFREEEQEVRIAGTPGTPGEYQFTVTAWCAGKGATTGRRGRRTYTMTVEP